MGKVVCDSKSSVFRAFHLSCVSLFPNGIVNALCCVFSVDDHGVHGEMRNDAMSVAATALDTNNEEKDISKHIKVTSFVAVLFLLIL